MVHHVAGKKRLLAAGYETDRRVIDTVAGRRNEGDAVEDLLTIHGDELGKPCLDHGPHTVVIDAVGRLARRRAERRVRAGCPWRLRARREALAICLLDPGEDVGRIRERRNPATVDQARVPADVVSMDMREQDVVHLFRGDARRGQPRQEGLVQTMERRDVRPVLVVAGRRVDQDRVVRGFDQPAVDALNEGAGRRIERARLELVAMALQRIRLGVRIEGVELERGKPQLIDPRDGCIANAIGFRRLRHQGPPLQVVAEPA